MGALAQGRHSDRAFAACALLLCQCIEPGHRMFPSGDQTNQVPPTISSQEAVNVLLQAVRKAKQMEGSRVADPLVVQVLGGLTYRGNARREERSGKIQFQEAPAATRPTLRAGSRSQRGNIAPLFGWI